MEVRDLKESQLDAIREVANIGAGHAATALSGMTNRTIMITVPRVFVRPLEEACDLVTAPDAVVAAVLMHMMGDLTGRALVLFPERSAYTVCDFLFRRPVGTTQGTGRDGAVRAQGSGKHPRQCLSECPERFHGHDAHPVRTQPGHRFERAVLTTAQLNFGHERDYAFCVETTFKVEGAPDTLGGHFLLLPDVASLRAIFDAIRVP